MILILWFLLCLTGKNYMDNREKMIIEQLQGRNIHDKKILEAMSIVPRELFVPLAQRELAYEDYPLFIGYGQTISQPFIVALITETVQLQSNTKILEIGTGCGYQAAILAELGKEVNTIEIIAELATEARQRLKKLGYKIIYIRNGDGYEGWPDQAPFDVIVVTAAPSEVPQTLIRQLKIGGKLIIPLGTLLQQLMRITRNEDGITEEILIPVSFVPMTHSN